MLAMRQNRMLMRAVQAGVRTNRGYASISSFQTAKIDRGSSNTTSATSFLKTNRIRQQRLYATTVDASSQQAEQSTNTQAAAAEMDKLVPDSIFASPSNTDPSTNLSRDAGRKVVSIVLQQLRDGLDATNREEVLKMEEIANENVKTVLKDAHSKSASPLHQFTVEFLKQSRDPRRLPIASRLFLIAFGRDPLLMPDPTVETIQQGSPLFTSNQWGVNAAGYNWASMVLSGQALPPAGLHLFKRGSEEQKEAIKDQQAAAIRVYATLATLGDPQGMLGMGRILLASAQKTENTKEEDVEKRAIQKEQASKLRERAILLWTKAGEKELSEAWYELGIYSLKQMQSQSNDSDQNSQQSAKAQMYFEKGAKMDNIQCNSALAILLTQKAMQINVTPSPPERKTYLDQSFDHFKRAAELGDGQSAHQIGMRYLLRQEMIDEVGLGSEADEGAALAGDDGRSVEEVRKQASKRHLDVWGIEPDDKKAREWFMKGSDVGFMPAMMNYAGMLFEARGTENEIINNEERLKELRKSESLYAKVAAQAGVMAQQQQKQAATTAQGDDPSANLTAEMTMLAKDGLGKVQDAIRTLVEEMEK